MADPSIQAVVMTVEKNLPILIQAVQTQGPMFATAATNLVNIGGAVATDIASESGQAIACAGVAAKAAASANVSVGVSVMASASVSGSAGGPSGS
jgi:ribosomal protein S7